MAVPGPSPMNSGGGIDLAKDKSHFYQQQRSGRNRNFTHRENVELIRIWGDSQIQRKFETSYRNSGLWESIAEQMQDAGFNRSPLECKTRVANLKAQFFKLKRGIRPGSSPPDWPYFEMLQNIIDGGKGPTHYQYEQASGVDGLEPMDYGEYEFKRVGNPVQNGAYAALTFPSSSNLDSSSHDSYLESESNTFHNNSEDHRESTRKKKKRKVDDMIMYKLLDIERRSLKLQEERNEDERRMFKAVADFFNAMTGLITGQSEESEGTSSSGEPRSAPTLSETMMSLVDSLHSAQKKAAAAAASVKTPDDDTPPSPPPPPTSTTRTAAAATPLSNNIVITPGGTNDVVKEENILN